jgi:hypothetical protein
LENGLHDATTPLICSVLAAHFHLIYREYAAQLRENCRKFVATLLQIYREYATQLRENCRKFVATLLQIYRVVAALLLISSWKFASAVAVTLYKNVKNFIKTLMER